MTVANIVETKQSATQKSLSKRDRCDQCQARAYVRVTKNQLELMFCNHHFRSHEPAIIADEWLIDDQSQTLFDEVANMKKMSDDNF